MVTALILAGGVGTRMGTNIPKQYLCIEDKPILIYCLEKFEQHELIDEIIVVGSQVWENYVEEKVKQFEIQKYAGYAYAGKSRQHSVYSGLKYIKDKGTTKEDIVLIHEAVRPGVSMEGITDCVEACHDYDGGMLVVPVKDAIYFSQSHTRIERALKRDNIYAGQAPESYFVEQYFSLLEKLSDEELGEIRGCNEIAEKYNLKIKLLQGSDENFKITTMDDLKRFEIYLRKQKE